MAEMQPTPWGPRPEHWQVVPWASFATPAGDPIVVEPDSDLKQVTIRVRHQGIVERRYNKNKKRSIGTPKQKQIRAGQFLISRIDARNGACGFVPQELDGAIVTGSFRAFDLDLSVIDPTYFDYLVGMPIFWQLCESISDGSTNRVCLDMDLFDSFVFPIPPLSEQNRVASVLQSVGKAIEKTERVITKTEQLRDALLHELLTRGLPGHHTEWKEVPGLGTIPATWQVAHFGEVAKVVTGNTPPRVINAYYGGNTPWVKPSDLSKHFVSGSAEYLTKEGLSVARLVPSGSVLVSCIGTIGEVAIAKLPLCFNQQINALIPNKRVLSPFLYWSILNKAQYIRAIAPMTAVPILNKNEFSKIRIPLPSIAEQREIALLLDSIDLALERALTMKILRSDLYETLRFYLLSHPVRNWK